MTDLQRREFEAKTTELIEWLNKNGHPHMTIIITQDSAELVEGVVGYSTKAHYVD